MTDGTHFNYLIGRRYATAAVAPSNPQTGDEYYDSTNNRWYRYNGSAWKYLAFTTSTSTSTTSTSTSTTSTSTSTTTTSTSTTSTSTSTTTTV